MSETSNPQGLNQDPVSEFFVDNEGNMVIVREFPDGSQKLERPRLDQLSEEFRQAQAVHQLDPDHASEDIPMDASESHGPNLDIIREQVREEKLARGEYVPPDF